MTDVVKPKVRASLENIPIPPDASGRPSLMDLATQQLQQAIQEGYRDYSNAPRWAQDDLHELVDVMLPGDLVIVGALTGNGKTAFLMSEMDYLAAQQIATLYVPLELDPWRLRRSWAAWKLKIDPALVLRNRWNKLPPGAQRAHELQMAEQADNPYVHFPPDQRISIPTLEEWVRIGKDQADIKVVMLDHFHRMSFDGISRDFRVTVTEAARQIKDIGRSYGVVVIAAAQLNRAANVDEQIDRYVSPSLGRLKESSGIAEEADLVLMLSRKFRSALTTEDLKLIKAAPHKVRDLEDTGAMVVMCRKARLDDGPRDKRVVLHVENGRVTDRAPDWRVDTNATWEPE